MDSAFLEALLSATDPAEKAAIVAEFYFDGLPEDIALVVRRCIILHWFDQDIVEALIQDTSLNENEMKDVFERIVSLPFIEHLAWGKTFQYLTREGLLKRYIFTQPELLRTGTRLAAPAYELRGEDNKVVAEAVFCHIVSENHQAAILLLNKLLEQASTLHDLEYIQSLLQLQDEAEQLPFVTPLPLLEQICLLRGLIHKVEGQLEAAIEDYSQAISINPESVMAYVGRGTTYAEQRNYVRALDDYKYAIQLNSTFAEVYINRGIIYSSLERYKGALQDFAKALQLEPNNTSALLNKGIVLSLIELHDEALLSYEQALTLDKNIVNAFIKKGDALIKLGRFEDALLAYEQALFLNPDLVEAHLGKAKAFKELARFREARRAYERADTIDKSDPNQVAPSKRVGNTLLRATVIGINEYRDEKYRHKARLRFAATDAQEIASLLQNSPVFTSESVTLLMNEKATRAKVRDSLNATFTRRSFDSNTIALFYFAGHVVVNPYNKRIFLCCYDVDFADPEAGGIRLNDIYEWLESSSVECIIIIIDACFSGGIVVGNVDHLSAAQQAMQAIEVLPYRAGKTVAVFAAGGSDKTERERMSLNHGIFTYELLRGWLHGEAREKTDGIVYLRGLANFLTHDLTKYVQKPQIIIRGLRPIALWKVEQLDTNRSPLALPLAAGRNLSSSGMVYHPVALPRADRPQTSNIQERNRLIILFLSLLALGLIFLSLIIYVIYFIVHHLIH